MTVDWNHELLEQLTWHWTHLRARFDGLTDEEYFWEPVEGCWSIRPREAPGTAPIRAGAGDFTADFAAREPVPAPVTTIAWRLAHLIVGVFGMRVAGHFGGPAMDYPSHHYAGTAAQALAQLDEQYGAWVAGVRSLGQDGLAQPSGPSEGPFAEYPMATLVLHIHREAIHHGAEVALLRDLYLHRSGAQGGASASAG